jgi:hypothetical protein
MYLMSINGNYKDGGLIWVWISLLIDKNKKKKEFSMIYKTPQRLRLINSSKWLNSVVRTLIDHQVIIARSQAYLFKSRIIIDTPTKKKKRF